MPGIKSMQLQENTTQNEQKNQAVKAGPEVTPRIEDRENKRVTMTVFHMFMKLKERINILSREMENILKDSN